jgi:hypothetical protein
MVQHYTFAQAWGPRKKEVEKQESKAPVVHIVEKEIVLQPKATEPVPPAAVLAAPSTPPPRVKEQEAKVEWKEVREVKEVKEVKEEVISLHLHRQIVNLFFFMHIASLVAILVLIFLKA